MKTITSIIQSGEFWTWLFEKWLHGRSKVRITETLSMNSLSRLKPIVTHMKRMAKILILKLEGIIEKNFYESLDDTSLS